MIYTLYGQSIDFSRFKGYYLAAKFELPVIKSRYPSLFDDYDVRRNRLYSIDSITVNAINYLIQSANRLVVRTSGKGMPDKLDMDLQRKYYYHIYGIDDDIQIVKSSKEICYSICKESELE